MLWKVRSRLALLPSEVEEASSDRGAFFACWDERGMRVVYDQSFASDGSSGLPPWDSDPPDVILDSSREVELSKNHRIRLLALVVRKPEQPGGDTVIVDGDLNPITSADLLPIVEEYGMAVEDVVAFASPSSSVAHDFRVVIGYSGPSELPVGTLRQIVDPVTDLAVGEAMGSTTAFRNGKGIIVNECRYYGWSDSDIEIKWKLPLAGLRWEELQHLVLIDRSDFIYAGPPPYMTWAFLEKRGDVVRRVESGGVTVDFDRWPDREWKLAVRISDSAPLFRLRYKTKTGAWHEAFVDSHWFLFAHDQNEIESLELHLSSLTCNVSIPLDSLPGNMEVNRNLDDLLDVRFHGGRFDRRVELDLFLQANLRRESTFWSNRNRHGPEFQEFVFPLRVEGPSMRSVLDQLADQIANEELHLAMTNEEIVVLHEYNVRSVFQRAIPPLKPSVMHALWASLTLVGLKLLFLALLRPVRRHLKLLGYGFTAFETELLWINEGRCVWRLPSRDELGAIPGVNPDNVRSVAAFLGESRVGREREAS